MDLRETVLKPLNDFRLKAACPDEPWRGRRLRREGSLTQTSPSEHRLQPEASEGLQARVSDTGKAFVVPETSVGTEPDPPVSVSCDISWMLNAFGL